MVRVPLVGEPVAVVVHLVTLLHGPGVDGLVLVVAVQGRAVAVVVCIGDAGALAVGDAVLGLPIAALVRRAREGLGIAVVTVQAGLGRVAAGVLEPVPVLVAGLGGAVLVGQVAVAVVVHVPLAHRLGRGAVLGDLVGAELPQRGLDGPALLAPGVRRGLGVDPGVVVVGVGLGHILAVDVCGAWQGVEVPVQVTGHTPLVDGAVTVVVLGVVAELLGRGVHQGVIVLAILRRGKTVAVLVRDAGFVLPAAVLIDPVPAVGGGPGLTLLGQLVHAGLGQGREGGLVSAPAGLAEVLGLLDLVCPAGIVVVAVGVVTLSVAVDVHAGHVPCTLGGVAARAAIPVHAVAAEVLGKGVDAGVVIIAVQELAGH